MGIFSKQKGKGKLALVFDIGSSSVGGAVFEVRKPGIPKIILSVREPIMLETTFNVDRFLALTLKSLDIVASRICSSGVGKIDGIFCVLSSPWYASQTRVIKLEKNMPFIFNAKLADGLIKKEMNLFEEENLAKFSDGGDKIRPIEFKNMKTMLNGYATPEPFNKKAKKIEMSVFISMCGDRILRKMESAIGRHFHTEDIKFSSFSMASFAVARDMFAHQEDFLLVDVSGEMTDVSMIKKDVLCNSVSFPLGPNFMIRKVAEKLDCSTSEAKSFFSLYKDRHAAESVEKKLEPIISKLEAEWLEGFQESLFNLSSDVSIPSTIFMTVDRELADFFSDIIKAEKFSQYSLTDSKFRVIFLSSQTMHGLAAFKDDAERDPFLAILSVYINRFIC